MNGNKIAKISNIFLASLSLIAGIFLVSQNQDINEEASSATSISFNPTSQEVHLGQSFSTQIEIDSGTEKITGIDIVMAYDPTKINISEIKPTSEITNFTSVIKNEIDNSKGMARYVAFTFDKNLGISGKLNVLTISGLVPQSSTFGKHEIKFSPETILIATNAGQNVLTNTKNLTITATESEPNSCGGTCGSNNNCKSNLYCYQGYCRNPICSNDTDCNCVSSPTPIATTVPTIKAVQKLATLKPIKTAMPSTLPTSKSNNNIQLGNFDLTPVPTAIYYKTEQLPREPDTDKFDKYGFLVSDYISTIFAIIGTIALVIIIFIIKKAINSKKPHILPPTNI